MTTPTPHPGAETATTAARTAAKKFIDAFNAQDHEALVATLNYPHVRLTNGVFRTTASATDFIAPVTGTIASSWWSHSPDRYSNPLILRTTDGKISLYE